MMRSLPSLVALISIAAPSLAEGLDPARVPAETRLLVHVDLESLQRSDLWRLAVDHATAAGALDLHELTELEQRFGVDLLRDLRSVTVCGLGADLDKERTVVLASASPAIETVLGQLALEEGYARRTVDGRTVHTWSHDGETLRVFLSAAKPDGSRVAAISASEEALSIAAAVLEGSRPSLARAEAPAVAHAPRAGAFVFVSAAELPAGLDFGEAQILKSALGLSLELGERAGNVFAHLSVSMADEEQAMDMIDVLEGLRALALLACRTEPASGTGLARVVRAIDLDVRQGAVLLDFEYSVLGLLAELRALGEAR